jgi:hypothetical protein
MGRPTIWEQEAVPVWWHFAALTLPCWGKLRQASTRSGQVRGCSMSPGGGGDDASRGSERTHCTALCPCWLFSLSQQTNCSHLTFNPGMNQTAPTHFSCISSHCQRIIKRVLNCKICIMLQTVIFFWCRAFGCSLISFIYRLSVYLLDIYLL